ncbi:MAG: hypothetical protein FWC26_06600 [Fibromonadales bacterium]|nr:hypothetical protein [Fibromonadales bacterium]
MRKAYFCIDGFTFKRISDFYKYEHKRHSRLNIAAMELYLRFEIERRLGWNSDTQHLDVEKHFYHPNESPETGGYRLNVEEAILKFEKALIDFGYAIHYAKHGRGNTIHPRPNESVYSDWLIASQLKKYDAFALFSTQGQYSNLLRKTMKCKIPVILIGWNGPCTNSSGIRSEWKTDKSLIECADVYCPLEKILNSSNRRNPIADVMFERIFCPSYLLSQRCG